MNVQKPTLKITVCGDQFTVDHGDWQTTGPLKYWPVYERSTGGLVFPSPQMPLTAEAASDLDKAWDQQRAEVVAGHTVRGRTTKELQARRETTSERLNRIEHGLEIATQLVDTLQQGHAAEKWQCGCCTACHRAWDTLNRLKDVITAMQCWRHERPDETQASDN